ncbi:MAG: peptidylprolyl isomerase, partial [Candidatus Zixiibacteriota bacterium]
MGRILIVTFIIVTSISSLIWGCGENDKPLTPPEPNVVATFDGGKVTIEQVEEKYQSLMPCCRGRYKGLKGRKILIKQMVFPQIISRFIKEKKIDLRGEIRERLGDITDEMNLSFLHMKIHEEILNAEDKYEDLRREYEFRKKRLEGEPLSERYQRLLQLHQELHPRLAEDVEKYLQRYIERLKSEARITKNFDVLSISVSDQELRDFYEEHAKGYHANEYKDPAKAKISEIRIKIENPAKESEARERAEKALAELRSGESFDQVAKRYSQGTGNGQHGSAPIWVTKGSRGKNFDNMVFSLFSGQISKVFRDGDSFYIVKLEAKSEERLKSLHEIYDQLRLEYQWEKGEKYLQENRDKVLFTIDGKPYTIGDLLNQYYKVTPPHKFKHEEA